jgi:hypothetical protein
LITAKWLYFDCENPSGDKVIGLERFNWKIANGTQVVHSLVFFPAGGIRAKDKKN